MPRTFTQQDQKQALIKLGRAIRSYRKQRLLSQEALALDAGIDRSHMGKIERGERNVTFLNILRISKTLDCKASKFLQDAGL